MNANLIFIIIQILLYVLFAICLLVGDAYLTKMIFDSSSANCEEFTNTPNVKTSIAAALASANLASLQAADAAATAERLAQQAANDATQAAAAAAAKEAAAAAEQAKKASEAAAAAKTPEEAQKAATDAAAAATVAKAAADKAAGKTPPVIKNYNICYDLTTTQLGFARFKMVIFWILYIAIAFGATYFIYKLYKYNDILFAIILSITLIMTVLVLVGGAFMSRYVFNGVNKQCFDPNITKFCHDMNSAEIAFAKIAVVFGWFYSIAGIFTIGMFIWEAN